MADPVRLTSADHALIHAVGWVACNVLHDPQWQQTVLEVMREAVPAVTPRHPMMEAFARVAVDLMAASGEQVAWLRARRDAQQVVERFHLRRMAEAHEVFRQGKGKENG
ncbi:hypothetical protein D2T29_00445 [Sinirhodobacter populi]|uniref:Uncharacterized protein n=1 Tax=Paenirhodobacter populi TaxID=2306993 RepID=A0A443KIA4_9RHOB|nr:hypothetical protein [Sinirhodobacter populi]RWR32501.1 hypothetical protein D2T31_00520 [Sinirhodobacter populi]RWR34980.1 hypothetical protein D2T29_00445 [Sinirhodobacter populi]